VDDEDDQLPPPEAPIPELIEAGLEELPDDLRTEVTGMLRKAFGYVGAGAAKMDEIVDDSLAGGDPLPPDVLTAFALMAEALRAVGTGDLDRSGELQRASKEYLDRGMRDLLPGDPPSEP
jgi:hypothetical protein